AARAMQRAPSARTEGAGRDRKGRLGATDAATAAPGLPRGEPRTRAGPAAQAGDDRADRALLRCRRRGRAGLSHGATCLDEGQATRPTATPDRPQSAAAAQHAQSGRAPLPDRPGRAVHQQSRRARRADDEIAAENLRWLPLRAGRRGLRRYPIADLDRQKAGLGSAPDTHSRTGASDRHSPLGLTTPPTWLVTYFAGYDSWVSVNSPQALIFMADGGEPTLVVR